MCREQISMHPHDENLLLLLAISLHRQGRLPEAIGNYRRLTELFPTSGLHWGNYATALRESGALEAAAQAYVTARRLDPGNAGILLNHGLLLLQQRSFVAARETLLDAYLLQKDSPHVCIHAARACSMCSDTRAGELVKSWRQWIPLRDDDLQRELATVLTGLGDVRGGAELLEDLVRRSPGQMEVRIQLAALYERMNRLDDAAAALRDLEAMRPAPEDSMRQEMLWQQARLVLREGDPVGAQQLLEQGGPRDGEDYAYYYMLAEILDRRGAARETMQALAVAHERQAEELKLVVPQNFAPDAPILSAATTVLTAGDYARWPVLQAPDAAASPVFIVGFPRSGTTLLEQMLDAHPDFQSMDERPFFNILSDRLAAYDVEIPRDLYRLSQRDCDELRKDYWELVDEKIGLDWKGQLVDKNPMNMLWLPLIHRLFPAAKIILALRHPCDVILSCYMQSFRSAELATACTSLERLARAYVTAMRYWIHHVEMFHPDVLVSRYEDLVRDFPQQTRRFAGFLGVRDETPFQRFDQHAQDKGYIGTPSYTQVIQPVNRKGLGRWGRYRDEFEPLLPVLEPMLKHWGYAGEPDA